MHLVQDGSWKEGGVNKREQSSIDAGEGSKHGFQRPQSQTALPSAANPEPTPVGSCPVE